MTTTNTPTAAAETTEKYRIARSTSYLPSHLALAKPYTRLEDALADMGDGLVIAADGHIAAFHERHEPFVAAMLSAPAASSPETDR